jgi:exopolysaccharide production protein ExoY
MSEGAVAGRGALLGAPKSFELPAKGNSRRRGDAAGRVVDLTVALLLIGFTLPLLAVIALAVKLQGGGSVLCEHQRVGRGGRLFGCLKFRIAYPDRRVTRVGDFLRQSGLDELPLLFNVLHGDMSIIGPPPIAVAEVARYGHRLALYCSVRPGITGLWQIIGRDDRSYRRRVATDSVYAEKKSLVFDLKLLLLAIPGLMQ